MHFVTMAMASFHPTTSITEVGYDEDDSNDTNQTQTKIPMEISMIAAQRKMRDDEPKDNDDDHH